MLRNSRRFIYEFNSFLRRIVSVSSILIWLFPIIIFNLEINYNSRYLKSTNIRRHSSQRPDSHRRISLFYWIQKAWMSALGLKKEDGVWGIRRRKWTFFFFKVHNYGEGKCTPLKATKMISHIAVQVMQYVIHWLFLWDQFLTPDQCITSQGVPRDQWYRNYSSMCQRVLEKDDSMKFYKFTEACYY